MRSTLPHAVGRVPDWIAAWRTVGRLVLLLDFDGTLAPIVERPELARPLPMAKAAVERLQQRGDVDLAVVSGRGLADARSLLGLPEITYAGNHGMEIEGPGIREVHAEAAAARPLLDRVAAELRDRLRPIDGVLVEDKGLTLSIHYRLVEPERIAAVREAVERTVGRLEKLRVTEGKMVFEIRPRVEWNKGRAVEFLLECLQPPPGAPIVYLGDDATDEDAFRALAVWQGGSGEGVLVAEEPAATAARSYLRNPAEVADLLSTLANG